MRRPRAAAAALLLLLVLTLGPAWAQQQQGMGAGGAQSGTALACERSGYCSVGKVKPFSGDVATGRAWAAGTRTALLPKHDTCAASLDRRPS